MSDSTAGLRGKIARAGDLQSVVRAMKAVAASSIGQYEQSVGALADYARTVEMGLGACFRARATHAGVSQRADRGGGHAIGAVVFGSDQGLVGQFNDVVADYAVNVLAKLTGTVQVWAVGDRVHARLADAGLPLVGLFPVPGAVSGITALVGQILAETETRRDIRELYLVYNRRSSGASYAPVSERLLPLDEHWSLDLAHRPWPTKQIPEVMGAGTSTLRALIREYLFVSLFRACAQSLASENASRLAAMTRADKNIDDLLKTLHDTFHRLRQSSIDEELFDVVSGFEALGGSR
ncbi:MAG: F0F1 ATP synthase subunit gamma [Gemmatimonadaceae bacterium]